MVPLRQDTYRLPQRRSVASLVSVFLQLRLGAWELTGTAVKVPKALKLGDFGFGSLDPSAFLLYAIP